MSSEKIKCDRCQDMVPADKYIYHLEHVHGLDLMAYMKFIKTWRGLGWTFLVFWIGVILGILIGGLA